MQKVLRTCFKKEIICEFIPPKRRTNKVIILCSGMPGYPGRSYLEYFNKKGFWVFQPRYRGSWESHGKFLAKSPHLDIIDIIDELPKGFISIKDGKGYNIKNPEVYLIGGSFGGPAAILASRDKRVKKAIAMSPVIDWTKQKNTEEPLDFLYNYVTKAFANGYRIDKKEWKKLESGRFYSPITELGDISGEKIWIIHAKDDNVVPYEPSKRFAKSVGSKLTIFKKGGHDIGKIIVNPKYYKKVRKFLLSKT